MNKILFSAGLIAFLTILSKFFAFIRDILMTSKIGISQSTDAYFAAHNIIDFFITFFGLQAMLAVTTTTFAKTKVDNINQKDKNQYYTSLILFLSIVSLLICLIPILWPKIILNLIMGGFNTETLNESSIYLRILAGLILIRTLVRVNGSIFGVKKNFFLQNIHETIANLIVLLSIPFSNKDTLLRNMSFSFLLTYIFLLFIQFILLRNDFNFIKISKRLLFKKSKYFAKLAIPIIAVTASFAIATIIDKSIISRFDTGLLTLLTLAQNISSVSILVFLAPIMKYFFPIFSLNYHSNELKKLSTNYSISNNLLSYTFIPIIIFSIYFRIDIIKALYFRGAFTLENVHITSQIFLIYSLAIIPNFLYQSSTFVILASQKTKILGIYGTISCLINIISSITLSKLFGYIGIPIGSVISLSFYAIALRIHVKNKLKIQLKNIHTFKIITLIFSSLVICYFLEKFIMPFIDYLNFTTQKELFSILILGSIFVISILLILIKFMNIKEIFNTE